MFTRSNVLFFISALCVFFGTLVEAVEVQGRDSAPPVITCDSKCRMRFTISFCDNGPCVQFLNATCLYCTLNGLCVDNKDFDPVKPDCKVPLAAPFMTLATYYLPNQCDQKCDCAKLPNPNLSGQVEANLNDLGNPQNNQNVGLNICRQ